MESLVACDFFTKPVYTLRGKVDAYVLVFLHLGSRRVYMSQPTIHPDEAWVMQQARNVAMWLDDHGIEARYLIHDRDTKFTRQFDAFWNGTGVRCIRIPPKAPQANTFCESFIGTCKHQCLNHFVCFGLGQLAHINRVWLDYYHTQRPHQGTGNNVISADFGRTSAGPIKRQEQLGGIVAWEIFPRSFREFLDGKGIESDGPLSTNQRLTIQKAFEDYWQVGGFPGVNRLDQRQRIEADQANWNTILASIIGHHNISHPRAVIDLAHWLVDNTGSFYSISHLTDYLKSLGHRVRKSSVVDWLVAFEDAGLLFSVNIFSRSLTRISVNPRKVYCIDHAMVTSVSSGILNSDSLLENLVFNALRRVTPEIFYFKTKTKTKTKTGREGDLVALLPSVPGQERTILLIQVCASLADPHVKQSEVRSLSEAMVELAVAEGTIVTWRTMKPSPWASAPSRWCRSGGFCWR
jgi:hypothetical protein